MDKEKIKNITAPYYDEFTTTGILFDNESVSHSFLRAFRWLFGRFYLKEVKFILKLGLRESRNQYRLEKYKLIQKFKADFKELKAPPPVSAPPAPPPNPKAKTKTPAAKAPVAAKAEGEKEAKAKAS